MSIRSEKNFWIEMSIREISQQAHFAELAYRNINLKVAGGVEGVFSSIHSFFSHCTMISKMLKAVDKDFPKNKFIKPMFRFIYTLLTKLGFSGLPISIGNVLGILDSSDIHRRKFRNHLEHYDERLKQWIRRKGINSIIATYNIGPKEAIQIPNTVFVSHYDPNNKTFTFVNEDFNLDVLYNEARRIKKIADNWLRTKTRRRISSF